MITVTSQSGPLRYNYVNKLGEGLGGNYHFVGADLVSSWQRD